MTPTSLTGAAALALALLASAPAMADGCLPGMFTDVRGDNGYYDTRVGECAYWGIHDRGDHQATTGQVIGYDARVLTTNRGYGANSHVDSVGDGARIVTQMRLGATGRVFNRGTNQIVMRGSKGSVSNVRVVGNGTYVRSEVFR